MDTMVKRIGNAIKAAQLSAGLTQEEMAVPLGIATENLTDEEMEWLELYRILPSKVKALVVTFAKVAAQQARE